MPENPWLPKNRISNAPKHIKQMVAKVRQDSTPSIRLKPVRPKRKRQTFKRKNTKRNENDFPRMLCEFTDLDEYFHTIDENQNMYSLKEILHSTDKELGPIWTKYEEYCATWFAYRQREKVPFDQTVWAESKRGVWDVLDDQDEKKMYLEDELLKKDLLEAPLYESSVQQAASKDLLDPEHVFAP